MRLSRFARTRNAAASAKQPATLRQETGAEHPNPPLRRLLLHLGIIAAYVVLAALLTWPMVTQFTTAVPGGGDAWQHIWNLWWVKKALVDLHTNPYFTNYLYYPDGVTLLFHTLVPLESALTIPFQLLGIDLVPLYNLVMFSSFVLAGYGTWLLVRDLTGNATAAFVAGIAFAFCPYHVGHLLGHMNLASLQWLPLYMVALFKALGAPGEEDGPLPDGRARLAWAALAGVWLVANAYTELIYVAFLGMFTALYLLWKLVALRRRIVAAGRALLPGLVVMGVVFLLLAGPFLFVTWQGQREATWMVMPPNETVIYSSDIVDSFVPSHLHPLLSGPALELARRFPERNLTERAVFLGYTMLALGLAALVVVRHKTVRFWALAAFSFWILSLGPLMHVMNRSEFTRFGVDIPLPYVLFYQLIPGFSVMRVPARFVVISSLALAVLAGYFLAYLFKRLAERRANAAPLRIQPAPLVVSGLLSLLIIFEFLAIPLPMAAPGYKIPFYYELAAEPGDFAVLELPLRPMSDYMAYQTVHGKKLVYGYLSRQPPDPFVAATPALSYLLNSTGLDDPVSVQAAQTGLAELQTADVRYAIVHWWAFTPEEKSLMQAKLARTFPNVPVRSYPEHQMDVYVLVPTTNTARIHE